MHTIDKPKIQPQQSDQLYRHLVETANAVPWTFDLKTLCFTYVGPQAEKMLGYPVEDWFAKGFWESHIQQEDREWALDYCLTSAAKCEDHEFEYRMITADGNTVWVRDSVNVIADENGPYELQGFMFDITEHKKVETSLNNLAKFNASKNIEQFYRNCVESLAAVYGCQYAFIGLIADDAGTKVQTQAVWAGNSFAENFEYSLEGTPCADILDQTLEIIPRDAAKKYPDDEMLVDMGVESYFGSPLIDTSGKTIGLVSVLDTKPLEVTHWVRPILGLFANRMAAEVERNRAEKQLRLRDERMLQQQEALLKLSQKQSIVDADSEKYFQDVVETACKNLNVARASIWIYDKNPETIICHDLYEYEKDIHSKGMELSKKDYPSYFMALNEDRVIVANDAHISHETFEFTESYLIPNGIKSMLDAPLRVGGRMVGVLCCEHIGAQREWQLDEQNFVSALADSVSLSMELSRHKITALELSQHKEHLEELVEQRTESANLAKEEAIRANSAKSEFLSRMSHELRTPLNAVLGYAQLLELDEDISDEKKNNIREIIAGGEHLLKLIEEVMDLSRIEMGKITIQHEVVDMQDLIEKAVRFIKPQAGQRGISVEYQVSGSLKVLADKVRIEEVLLNLLSNAVKYNHENGQIWIDASRQNDGMVSFSVKDTGAGLNEEQQDMLFEPFSRLGAEYSGVEGTGIGLSIVKKLVELLGGEISVASEVGKGTTFKVCLPAAGSDD